MKKVLFKECDALQHYHEYAEAVGRRLHTIREIFRGSHGKHQRYIRGVIQRY
ncbi:hypothetical protein AAF463_24345 (plasmid) [Pantoea sp. BJ2]|uniref:Uncharacterized protein n=1 Tax=Pantoea sp. BJ2 TaxID=3141322 RepID=A0AAU7U3T5_9GAMM